eukprot:TRINITY_DN15969_c0_g1_i1.p1 TRINITY_DN15969_c0_g1~~TRINITY_DN15969_c0_g1_i1.p1  ORF type:complete len:886 (+),score=188.62 TRINITY_DN15969_c0_g1_i1:147-2804(+)
MPDDIVQKDDRAESARSRSASPYVARTGMATGQESAGGARGSSEPAGGIAPSSDREVGGPMSETDDRGSTQRPHERLLEDISACRDERQRSRGSVLPRSQRARRRRRGSRSTCDPAEPEPSSCATSMTTSCFGSEAAPPSCNAAPAAAFGIPVDEPSPGTPESSFSLSPEWRPTNTTTASASEEQPTPIFQQTSDERATPESQESCRSASPRQLDFSPMEEEAEAEAGPSQQFLCRDVDGRIDDVLVIFQQNSAELLDRLAAKVEEAGRVFREESSTLVGEILLRSEGYVGNASPGGAAPLLAAYGVLADPDCDFQRDLPRWQRRKQQSTGKSSLVADELAHAVVDVPMEPVASKGVKNGRVIAADAGPAKVKEARLLQANENQVYNCSDLAEVRVDVGERLLDPAPVEADAPGRNQGEGKRETARNFDHIKTTSTAEDEKHEDSFAQPRMLMPDVDELVKKLGKEKMEDGGQDRMYRDTGLAQQVAKSSAFEYASMVAIFVNAIWIFVDTDYNNATNPLDAAPIFQVVENLFCFYFTFELVTKVLALRERKMVFMNRWYLFDLFLVATMVFETWLLPIILAIFSTAASLNTELLKNIKLVRLTRAARVVRLLRSVPEFLVLLKALVAGIRAVFFTLVLMVAFAYIFAIVLKQLTEDTSSVQDDFFSTVPSGMKVLLISAIFPDVGDAIDAIAGESYIACILFVMSVCITALAMLNMLVGVLCEVVTMVAQVEKEGKSVEYISKQMREFMLESDKNADGFINKEEFLDLLTRKHVIKFLHHIEVDVRSLLEYIDVIFDPGSKFEFKDIIQIVRRVKGSNNCTVSDINDLRTWLGKELREVKSSIQHIETVTGIESVSLDQNTTLLAQMQEELHKVEDELHLQHIF